MVDVGAGIGIGVEDEGIAALAAYLAEHIAEPLPQGSIALLLSLGILAAGFLLELNVLGHQLLQLGLPFVENGGCQLALYLQESLVFTVELFFHTLGLGLILCLQVAQLFLHDDLLGHGLESLLVAEIAELQLCGGP